MTVARIIKKIPEIMQNMKKCSKTTKHHSMTSSERRQIVGGGAPTIKNRRRCRRPLFVRGAAGAAL